MKNSERTPAHCLPEHYLIVACGEYRFALPSHDVQEILYPHPVTPLPFVPSCIDGLVSIEGTIAVQVSLANLCGTTPAAVTELVLIETGRARCALQVDAVIERTVLVPQALQDVSATIDKNLLSGEASCGNTRIYIIDPQRIGQRVQTSPLRETGNGMLGKVEARAVEDSDLLIACLVITVNGDRYAFELDSVTEITEAVTCTPVPDAPACLQGFCLLREQAVPVIDLAAMLSYQHTQAANTGWLIVVERDGLRYGLHVESLLGIEKFPFDSYQPVVDDNNHLSGLFIHEDVTTMLLSTRRLMDGSVADAIAPYTTGQVAQQVVAEEETESFLQIMLCEKPYAVAIHHVKRIAPFFPMENISDTSGNIRGAIDIDGKIIPVLAIEKALKIEREITEGEYIIVGDATREWAICVDAAHNIVKVPVSDIRKMAGQDSRWLGGIVRIDDGLVPLLDFSPSGNAPEAGL